ncbi:DNA polymerase III subunit epsilon [Methylobacterium sp. WL120]|uniref:DNA polymerase III subunit epsilon n=1 Tax=Methylobacterium sp. WL120 TaxID=2603887 RepID=UPI001FEF0C60|nr:DNA polymerase III subunit epsilon [Methylobacterium sp. WL120]
MEVGAVELIDFIPTGRTFHAYINPQRDVPDVVVKIHGLTYDFLKKHPTIKRVMPKFLEFVGDAPMVAHNAPFDVKMMNAELKRLEMPVLSNEMIDTLPMSKRAKPGGQHNLDAMCRHFNIDNSKREKHGALLDSEILAEVYLHLNGGRQFGIDLAAKVDEVIEVSSGQYQGRRFISRASPDETAAHTAFITDLGAKALWNRYISDEARAKAH